MQKTHVPVALTITETKGHRSGDHHAAAHWLGGCAAAHGHSARNAFEALEKLVEGALSGQTVKWGGMPVPAIEVVHVVEKVVDVVLTKVE